MATYETLTPDDRENVFVCMDDSDTATFTARVKDSHPDTFDQVIADMTATVWAGGDN